MYVCIYVYVCMKWMLVVRVVTTQNQDSRLQGVVNAHHEFVPSTPNTRKHSSNHTTGFDGNEVQSLRFATKNIVNNSITKPNEKRQETLEI